MRELPTPPEIAGDDDATEMIRVWIAHEDQHVSLHLGMWEDAEDCEIDERDAWGELLADTVGHVAHGLAQSHGWSASDTTRRISMAFAERLGDDPPRDLEGGYVDD